MCDEHTDVKILQEGYSREVTKDGKTGFAADCSVSLITGNFSPILVDTSGPWSKSKLISRLEDFGYSCEDIKTVVCTHGHSDHVGNMNIFLQAKFIVSFDVCDKDGIYEDFDFNRKDAKYILNDDVYVIPTPGHTAQDVSVVVENTSRGTIVIAGDIFENECDSSDWQSLSTDVPLQQKSREIIKKLANYIVPGHGKMFQVS